MVNPLFPPCGVAQVAVISLACSASKPLSSRPLRMSWSAVSDGRRLVNTSGSTTCASVGHYSNSTTRDVELELAFLTGMFGKSWFWMACCIPIALSLMSRWVTVLSYINVIYSKKTNYDGLYLFAVWSVNG